MAYNTQQDSLRFFKGTGRKVTKKWARRSWTSVRSGTRRSWRQADTWQTYIWKKNCWYQKPIAAIGSIWKPRNSYDSCEQFRPMSIPYFSCFVLSQVWFGWRKDHYNGRSGQVQLSMWDTKRQANLSSNRRPLWGIRKTRTAEVLWIPKSIKITPKILKHMLKHLKTYHIFLYI